MRSYKLKLGSGLGALVMLAGGAAASPPATPAVRSETATMRIAQKASDGRGTFVDIPNSANLSLQISPDTLLGVGTKISFRITAKKAGYVLLVDIDADGRMSQIFPSPEMIAQSAEAATNFIKPGQELLIPNSAAQKHGFQYVIAPPLGTAAVVAILSDRRVQILDLPDGARMQGSASEIINAINRWTNELRIPDASTGKPQPSNWSFDIKTYSISE